MPRRLALPGRCIGPLGVSPYFRDRTLVARLRDACRAIAHTLLLLSVLPSGIAGQVTGQDAILVGLQRVGVQVGVVVSYDHPALIGEVQLRDRLVEVLELTLREAGITVTDDAASHLVLVIAAAPITVGEDVGGVAVSSILQLTESVLPGRIVRESIDSAPGVQAGARAWRAAYWDLARDREFWTTPVWSGALGVAVYAVDTYQADLERDVVRLVQDFANAYRRANPRE